MIINGGTRWTRFFYAFYISEFYLCKICRGGGRKIGKNREIAYRLISQGSIRFFGRSF